MGKACSKQGVEAGTPAKPARKETKAEEIERLRKEVEIQLKELRAKEETLQKLRTESTPPFVEQDTKKLTTAKQLKDEIQRIEKAMADLEAEEESISKSQVASNAAELKRATSSAGMERKASMIGHLSVEERQHLTDPSSLLSDEFCYGLAWDRTYEKKPMGPKSEALRTQRREGTKQKVAKELGLRRFGESAEWAHPRVISEVGSSVHVWIDKTTMSGIGKAPAGGDFLLGRYDVVAAKAVADLDRNFEWIKGSNYDRCEFWVAHAAAINVGESLKASDWPDFSKPGVGNAPTLDEESYFEAMRHVLANVAEAVRTLEIRHLIFFPFGMGAFIRHLNQLDQRFSSAQEMQRLRRRLALEFITVLARETSESVEMHLCLAFSEGETLHNADAFLRALLDSDSKEVEAFAKRTRIHVEGDCLELAQTLADSGGKRQTPEVLLVNGANRCLLGNHWFDGRAKMAIDENLHRRSWRMARTSYLVNAYGTTWQHNRQQNCLEDTVTTWLRGQVHYIEKNKGSGEAAGDSRV